MPFLPEKRMSSSMIPTIFKKEGELLMSVGATKGPTIVTSVLQTILNVNEFDMTMQGTVEAPHFHHQWLPDEIRMEPSRFNREAITVLEQKGYALNEERSPVIGIVDGIFILPKGSFESAADSR